MSMTNSAGSVAVPSNRWLQLIVGIVCMSMIANLQYGWTNFVNPINAKYGWSRENIQWAFFVFVLLETWLVPIEGWFVDRYGPKFVVAIGGVLVGIAWALNSVADSLFLLYVAAAIGGVGAGAVYGTCVGNALKWFPDRRGLAAGLTAAGFGAGSALTVAPIVSMIKTQGYEATFLYFGIGQGVIVFVLSWLLAAPATSLVSATPARVGQSRRDYHPLEILQTPVFWVMYVMFVLVGAGGLMVTAQLAPIAKDFKVADIVVDLMIWSAPAIIFAQQIDRIMNGITRPLCGWVSDHIGRENTMFIAFGLEAIGIWLLSVYGANPVLFVILSGIVFFAWGEIYSLFPSLTGDLFGPKFAATNAGLLYTAKGTAAILVPYSSKLFAYTGSWHVVFLTAAAMNAVAAVMALAVLKPMRQRAVLRNREDMIRSPAVGAGE